MTPLRSDTSKNSHNAPIDSSLKLGDVKFVFSDELETKFQYKIELFHLRGKFPELRLKEYNPERNTSLIVKFCESKMVSLPEFLYKHRTQCYLLI